MAGVTAGSLLGLFTVGMMSRYVNTKGVIYGAVGSMVIVTFIMIGAQSLPKRQPLPTLIDECDFMLNKSTTATTLLPITIMNGTISSKLVVEDSKTADDIPLIFQISFMYYTLLGSLLLVLIAYFVSWLTGGCPPFDEKLLATFMRSKDYVAKEENGLEQIHMPQTAEKQLEKAHIENELEELKE